MTENKANISIKHAVCVLEAIGNGLTLSNEKDREDACVLAIQALEDMQKLKELGECYVIPKKGTFEINGINVHTAVKELEQYRAIGLTPKMVKEMIESEKLASHQAIIRGVKLEQYEAIGTIEEFKALKEKSVAKKPDYEGDGYYNGELVLDTWICRCCGKHYEVDYEDYDYCPKCGQHIDHSGLTEDD